MHPHHEISPELEHAPGRVLMTADTIGGVWTYALELARTLCEQDIEIALATMGAPLSEAQWRETARIPNLGVFESSYKLEWMHDPWDDMVAAGEWLLELERRIRPDVIHLNHYAHGALRWKAPTLIVAHSCMLAWWEAVHGQAAPVEWESYRTAVQTGLRSADMVVAPSRAMLRDLERFYGLLPRKEVVPNGREISFRDVPKEQFIFSAGRVWDRARNIDTLDAAAPDVAWPICVAGDPHEPGGKSVSFENVRLLGQLGSSQMADRYERASIFCLPARYEAFGVCALEAALANCALVLGDIPALREIWRDSAVFVDPNDTKGLSDALNRLINEPAVRTDLAERAHNRALEFTTLRTASSYLALYAELMKPERSPELAGAT
jgi:glycogen(starch) synthase